MILPRPLRRLRFEWQVLGAHGNRGMERLVKTVRMFRGESVLVDPHDDWRKRGVGPYSADELRKRWEAKATKDWSVKEETNP